MVGFFLSNSNTLTVTVEVIQDDGTYVPDNGATLTCSIVDQAGTDISGGDTFPLAIPYIAASSGRYQVDLNSGLNGVDRNKAVLQVRGTSSAGKDISVDEPLHFLTRKAG